jgi:hypothetical protein
MPACAHLPAALGLAQTDPHEDRGIKEFCQDIKKPPASLPAEGFLSLFYYGSSHGIIADQVFRKVFTNLAQFFPSSS